MSERNAQIIALARAGEMTYREIGRKFGISHERVGQIVRPVIGVKSRWLTHAEHISIIDAAQRGLCTRQIGRAVGRSNNAVKKVLDRAGINRINGKDVFGAEARARAVDFVRFGASYQEAADCCGMTKNAVIGACYRAGVSAAKRACP